MMITSFEESKDRNVTATYQEAIDFYKDLGKESIVQVSPFGMTDSGHPLHEVIIDSDKDFDPRASRAKGKAVLFINNGIHPGEPCGIDATMMLARDIIKDKENLLDHITIVIIPIYNIGGALNRNSHSRTNQVGPESYGFRGNAKNYDLNRDFVKCDSQNALSFNRLFTKWNPDVFIDNHTSNGADYQYVMTLIATQKDKLEQPYSAYMTDKMLPELYSKMDKGGYEMIPYVDVKDTPDTGIYDFADYGRYSSGYGALHNTISFMPETHMLKPYNDRVLSTYLFMEVMLEHMDKNYKELLSARAKAFEETQKKLTFHLDWAIDYSDVSTLTFKGYEARYKPSEVTGQSRLYYDRSQPYTKEIPYYNNFKPTKSVEKPKSYIIPQAYANIIERMEANGVKMSRLEKDTKMNVEVYRIEDYKSTDGPYEGHYLHYNTKVTSEMEDITYHKGDYIIKVNQKANRYIVETLEPTAPDSWFSWNFLDGILMQKEHFSSYVFEDLAAEILENDEDLRKKFLAKRDTDVEFAENARAQLQYIYEHSKHYEPTYMRYPIGRIL